MRNEHHGQTIQLTLYLFNINNIHSKQKLKFKQRFLHKTDTTTLEKTIKNENTWILLVILYIFDLLKRPVRKSNLFVNWNLLFALYSMFWITEKNEFIRAICSWIGHNCVVHFDTHTKKESSLVSCLWIGHEMLLHADHEDWGLLFILYYYPFTSVQNHGLFSTIFLVYWMSFNTLKFWKQ